MKRMVKSYLVFTSFVYRLVLYLLLPLVALGTGILCSGSIGAVNLMIVSMILSMFEILSDYWLFVGIQTKDSANLDFLKTSGRGMQIIKNALIMDLLRKLLTAAVVLTISYLVALPTYDRERGETAAVLVYAVLVSYFCSVLGVFFARYGSIFWFCVLVGNVAVSLEIICWFLPGTLENIPKYVPVFVILGIMVSILAVRTARKKVEGSYYDK